MYKFSAVIFVFLLSYSVSADEGIYRFNMKFVDGIREMKVFNSGGSYYFNELLDKRDKILGARYQEYPLSYNKSGYSDNASKIGYHIKIVKNEDGISYPNWSDFGERFINDSKSSYSSILIETGEEDISTFKFFLKYDYNLEEKKVVLSDIFYESTSHLAREEDNWFSFYKVDIPKPSKLYDLSKYDAKTMTEFVVNELYKKRDTLPLVLLSKTENTKYLSNDAKVMSLCGDDKVEFSCQFNNSKIVSICSIENNKIAYKYGTSKKLELSLTRPTFVGELSENGEKYNSVMFSKDKYTYEVRDMLQDFEGDIYHSYKLMVSRDNKNIFESECEGISQYFDWNFRKNFH
ncbi:hypothetical protein SAMN04488136_12169 [Vibrio xiamenensis]|uniref:Uncharacterized protein n=1 Tax=Vibrio xiamenensis TaxID=861298 RepID=A0A1G8DU81_9VIBR|nr:hypothetical protein [Vibrio xiamenensis]SDH61165.1 hypothetical protein SAMN04488136_12169 [Vibrio xiamenensis]